MPISTEDVNRALHELGELRFGTSDVTGAMDRIVRTTHSIFGVDGAALMLVDAGHHLRNAAVSDERLAHLEDLQVRHHEGPCIDAFDDKQLVRSEDLTAEGRWPLFGPAAVERGLRAVLASPIPYNQQAVGVVAVVSVTRRPWTPEGELALVAFTDLAALLIATMLAGEQRTEQARQTLAAIDSRSVVERAVDLLAAREQVSRRAAVQRLRAMARAEHCALADIASELASGGRPGR